MALDFDIKSDYHHCRRKIAKYTFRQYVSATPPGVKRMALASGCNPSAPIVYAQVTIKILIVAVGDVQRKIGGQSCLEGVERCLKKHPAAGVDGTHREMLQMTIWL